VSNNFNIAIHNWQSIFLVAIFIFILSIKNKRIILIGLIILSFSIGISLNNQQKRHIEERIQFYNSHTINAIAHVKDINFNDQLAKYALTLQIKKLGIDHINKKANDMIIFYTKKTYLLVDDTVYINGLRCPSVKNERIKEYLIKNRLAGTAFTIKKLNLIKRPHWSLTRFIHTIKNRMRLQLQKKLSTNTFHFFSSIFLGKKNTQEQHIMKRPFLSWGIVHYLARSGLHLAIIFFIATLLVNIFSITFLLKVFIVLLFCLLYALLTWPSISFKRALLLIISYQICHLLKIPIDSFHLLNIALLLCIIANTQLIFSLDFQLTFILTYTLILIGKQPAIDNRNTKSCA